MERLSVRVRVATTEDAAAIAHCLAELGYGTPVAAVQEKLDAFSTGNTDRAFIALSGESLLGTVSIHLIPLFHAYGYLGRLTALSVAKSHRRHGVGRALVDAAEQWALGAGALRIEVTSGDHRPGAHAFYASLGYESNERRFLKVLSRQGVANPDQCIV